METFAWLGRLVLGWLEALGRGAVFLGRVLVGLPGAALRGRELLRQLGRVGAESMVLILVSGAFVGMVLGLQGYNMLVRFGAEESLGLAVALALVRELGPVVSALLYAGRAGSALAAEIGLMKTTEQLAAMGMTLDACTAWSLGILPMCPASSSSLKPRHAPRNSPPFPTGNTM